MATKKATPEAKKAVTVNTSSEKTESSKTEVPQKTAKAEPAKTSTKEKAAKPESAKTSAAAKPEAKKAAKKTTARKTSVKKDIKVKAVVEYYGKQVEEKDMIASVKKAWTKSGRKIGEIKTIDLYIKPEEGAVYYVINGIDTGAVAF